MTRAQRLVLVASILGSFVAFLDVSVVNVALPAIRNDLGGGISAQQWIVDAYLVTLGSFILLAGSLSDLFGRKRVFAAGLVGFGVTSLLAAIAPGATVLIVARGLQGVTGALLVPSSLAMIIANFSGPDQGKAIGTWTAWTGISFILGPLLGGALVDLGSWRWVFAINVLPIAATLAVLARVPPEPAPAERGHVDLPGAALCALGLGGIIFGLIEAPTHGWGAPEIYLPLAGGVVRVRRLPGVRALRAASDARLRAVPHPQLRGRQRRHGRDLRRPVGVTVRADGVPAAGGRLFRDGGRAGADATDRDHVPARRRSRAAWPASTGRAGS